MTPITEAPVTRAEIRAALTAPPVIRDVYARRASDHTRCVACGWPTAKRVVDDRIVRVCINRACRAGKP